MTQEMLLARVWKASHGSGPHYLHVYVNHVRKKIEPDPTQPRFIHTEHSVGYRFNADNSHGLPTFDESFRNPSLLLGVR